MNTTNSHWPTVNASVVDLFCGAGGLTHGFFQKNFPIAGGIDIDESCRYPYEANNRAPFIRKDISKLSSNELNGLFFPDTYKVLVGCAPCQPFSTYNQKNNDPKWNLLEHFGEIIKKTQPDVVSMENVPQLMRFNGGLLFKKFVATLEELDFHLAHGVLYGPDFGLPQTRSRLVLIASRLGPISLPKPTHNKETYRTVADAIKKLPPLAAGEADPTDPLHRTSSLSPTNIARIMASKPGGTWRDWPQELINSCHKNASGSTYSGVYGRMRWDTPSPTITTQFFGYGNGRFGHPEQNRALSFREGAILQSFPKKYKFIEPGHPIEAKKLGRLIGNAVPVALAKAIATTIKRHIEQYPLPSHVN